MKKLFLPIALVAGLFIGSCNNEAKHDEHAGHEAPKTKADSLMEDVMAGHDVGMGKMGKLSTYEQMVQRSLDSIAKLPAKAQQAAAPLKEKLNVALEDLKKAEAGMNDWMDHFNMDSAVNNAEERIRYLAGEKDKVGAVKEKILSSLSYADSLLKAKF
jgi:hypothetical protein